MSPWGMPLSYIDLMDAEGWLIIFVGLLLIALIAWIDREYMGVGIRFRRGGVSRDIWSVARAKWLSQGGWRKHNVE